MPHDISLLTTIAAGLGLAFVVGLIAARFGAPPILGYLLAGVAVGPFTPGFVADTGLAGQLAEVGVILLMFGVGLHFSIADLLSVRRIAIPGAIGQVAVATALGALVSHLWGWSWGTGLVFGLSLSVASTVVLLFRYSIHTALTISASLAQIGEFSFILAALGVSLGLLPPAAQSLIVAGALLSITLNPFVFGLVEPT